MVTVNVKRFVATAAGTKAQGMASAKLTGLGQLPTSVTKNVTLAAARGGTCTILTLTLDTLDLKLLGLNVHLDKVVLTITGQRRGGVLARSSARWPARRPRPHESPPCHTSTRRSGGRA